MKVKVVLPKSSGLSATSLASCFSAYDKVEICSDNKLNLSDEPDLVFIEVSPNNPTRLYKIADHYLSKGAYVCMGGQHVSSQTNEARPHALTLFIGDTDDTFKSFIKDYKRDKAKHVYVSKTCIVRTESFT